jgi:hypothetical protein
MPEIFISYSSLDQDRVAPLIDALARQGWTVWWDRSILPGQNWDIEIEKRIKAAACVVVVWTRASIESEWVRLEAGIAREYRTLVPVRLDEIEPPATFRLIQTASLIGWDSSDSAPGFLQLSLGIRSVLKAAECMELSSSFDRSRALDAAIARELRVQEAANLIAMVRLPKSAGLKAILDVGCWGATEHNGELSITFVSATSP